MLIVFLDINQMTVFEAFGGITVSALAPGTILILLSDTLYGS